MAVEVGVAGATVFGFAVVTAAEVVGATVVVAVVGLAGAELVVGEVEVGEVEVGEGCAELQATRNKVAIKGTINRIKSLLTIETPFH